MIAGSVVLTLLPLVHVAGTTSPLLAAGKAKSAHKAIPPRDDSQLPSPVQEMLEMIQTAVASGRIDDLKDAIDWNEMKPDLAADGTVADPVAYWKSLSKAGDGQETLDRLGALLSGPPAVVRYGRDIENNRLFIWPDWAERPLATLSPGGEDQLRRLASADEIAAMKADGRYRGWRLVLGADGTWHSFRQDP